MILKMKKLLSMALCLSMVLSYVPVSAHADSIADQPHTEHTAECGYVEAVEGQPCTHVHSESCYESVSCVHICGEECAEGCAHSCSVESGCITMEKDCHHTHDADCGYSEGTAEIPCGHTHDESCGYASAVEAVSCIHNCEESGCTLNEDGTYICLHTEHDDACGYAEGSEEIPCTHTHDENCGYVPATEGTPCNHICSVIVGSSESCYKLLCSHAEEGQHDEICGYVEAVEGHPCKYENTESEAVAKVQAMIDALPDATDATEADRAAVEEAYNAFCELTAEQMAQITGVEKLTALVDLLSGQVETLEGKVSYIYRTYNTSTNAVESATKSVTEYTTVTGDMTTWSNGWYVVESDVTISSRITVSGNNVHLILRDGCTLTATEGITVDAGNGLTIYGQSDKDEQMGKLIAVISSTSAAIGSTQFNNAGNITIMGGSVTAENTNMSNGIADTGGAGIGGSNNGSGGTVTIFGGNVSATGGEKAPGIGGCKDSVGTITIFGGTVTASGRYSGAGIGAGTLRAVEGGSISIFGGTVNAIGKFAAAGIGGYEKTTSLNITILGGTVNATAGENWYNGAIGCKSYSMLSLSADGQTATVKDNYTLPYSYTIPSGVTLVIPSGASLTVPLGVTLKNYGTVVLDDGGSLVYPTNTGVSQIPRGLTTGTIKIGDTEMVWNGEKNVYRCKNGCSYVNNVCPVCGSIETMQPANDGYYEIYNADQLYWFAEQVNSGNNAINGRLMADVVVNANVLTADGKLNGDGSSFRQWTPIGWLESDTELAYAGTFNGNNKIISGLYYNSAGKRYVGLFGYNTGTICDLTVKDSYIGTEQRAGMIAGFQEGNGVIKNCHNYGTINGAIACGGIVGVSESPIRYCSNSGKITTSGNYVGGIVGCASTSACIVENCYNTGSVAGSKNVGGISGNTQYGGVVKNCYNASSVSGTKWTGAIVGSNATQNTGGEMNNCYFDNNLCRYGATGETKGTITNCSGKTSEEFKSGEVAWLLNGNSSDGVWKQTIGTDTYPSFTGDTVYRTTVCGVEIFSNTQIDAEHEMQDGICTRCGFCETDGIYYISTAEQLVLFAWRVNGGTADAKAVVVKDIALSGVFFPMIGTSGNPYSGTFNGNGHKITLDLTTVGQYTALFRYVNGATIQNLIVDGTITVSNKFAASIVGKSDGTTTIENCISAVKIVSTLADDGTHGGLVANVQSGTTTINNCGFIGSIEGANTYACGGMVGWSQGTTKISNSYVAATFTVNTKNGNTFARNPNNVTVENCYYLTALNETPSGATQMTIDQFRSGEVAYKLNGDQTNIIWKQTIGKDAYPNFTGNTVYYGLALCTSTEKSYSNAHLSDAPGSHSYNEKGFCSNTSPDGTACGAYQPCKGDGTETNPYQIGNAGELMWFAAVVNGGYGGTEQNKGAHGILTANIDMSGVNYTPIASTVLYYNSKETDKGYTGVFNGNYHVIKNLTVTGSSTEEISYGLFGTLSGTVKNLGIDNFTYNDNKKDCRVGAIAGQVLSDGVIIDCYVVNSTLKTNNYIAGAIAGCVYGGQIKNCLDFKNTVTGYKRIGHLVGDARADGGEEDRRGYVINCYSDGKVVGDYNGGSEYIQNCESNVSTDRFASGEIAWKLNQSKIDGIWKQTIAAGSYPTYSGETVYAALTGKCTDDISSYTAVNKYYNVQKYILIHDETVGSGCYTNEGFCKNTIGGTVCDEYQPAVKNEDFYEISNAGQLYWFAKQVDGGDTKINGRLMQNIDLKNRAWTPVGSEVKPFGGIFDGNGCTVNFGTQTVTTGDFGLIGYASGATVKKVTVTGTFTVDAKINHAGGIIGFATGSTVSDCTNKVNISLTGNAGGSENISGIVGRSKAGTQILRCANYGNIDASGAEQCIGGITGYANEDVLIQSCANYGNVSASGAAYVSGILGYVNNSSFKGVQNCLNTGAISGGSYVGAIIGWARDYATDTITGNYYLEGIAGFGVDDQSGKNATATAATTAQLASGEIAWLLNSKTYNGLWRQKVGTDAYPSFNGPYVDFDESSGSVVKVSIRWTEMSFTYTQGKWDSETHSYPGSWSADNGGGSVTVTNQGDGVAAISISYSSQLDGVAGNLSSTKFGVHPGFSVTSQLTLSGAPSESGFVNREIGTLTVTIGKNAWTVGDKVQYTAKDGNTYSAEVVAITANGAKLMGDANYEYTCNGNTSSVDTNRYAIIRSMTDAVGSYIPNKSDPAYESYCNRMENCMKKPENASYAEGYMYFSDHGEIMVRAIAYNGTRYDCLKFTYNDIWINVASRIIFHYCYVWDVGF